MSSLFYDATTIEDNYSVCVTNRRWTVRYYQGCPTRREILSKRRVTLDKMQTITDFAKDMSEYPKTGELTQSRAFIRSFVKEICGQAPQGHGPHAG